MARKNGTFSKFLNFIGLVDDGDSREDTYGEEYQNGNYGRQAAYTPARSSSSRSASSSRGSTRRSLPEARPSRFDDRSERSSRASGYADADEGYDDYSSAPRRTSSRFDDGYDYAPRQERASSRFAEQPSRRASNQNLPQTRQSQQPQSPNRMRVSRRSRTVMYSLHSLEDCCEVIDQLIANNTVVLTMDELDGRLMQRAVDTLSGAVFALHASIRKASDKTYLVAPMSVEVNDAFDMDRAFR